MSIDQLWFVVGLPILANALFTGVLAIVLTANFNARISDLRSEMSTRITDLRAEMVARFANLEKLIDQRFESLEREIHHREDAQ